MFGANYFGGPFFAQGPLALAAEMPIGPTYEATYQATEAYIATAQATTTYTATYQATTTYESEWD